MQHAHRDPIQIVGVFVQRHGLLGVAQRRDRLLSFEEIIGNGIAHMRFQLFSRLFRSNNFIIRCPLLGPLEQQHGLVGALPLQEENAHGDAGHDQLLPQRHQRLACDLLLCVQHCARMLICPSESPTSQSGQHLRTRCCTPTVALPSHSIRRVHGAVGAHHLWDQALFPDVLPHNRIAELHVLTTWAIVPGRCVPVSRTGAAARCALPPGTMRA